MRVEPEELIAGIQRLVVHTLDLPIPPAGVNPDQPVAAMEIAYQGNVYEFDSVDLVEILTTLEDELQADFLGDPAVTELAANGTLRNFAEYVTARLHGVVLQQFCARTTARAAERAMP